MPFKLCLFLFFTLSEAYAAMSFGGRDLKGDVDPKYSIVRNRGEAGNRVYVVTPTNPKAQAVKVGIRDQAGRDTLRYEGCDLALAMIAESTETNRPELALSSIEEGAIEYKIALSNTKADKSLLNVFSLESIAIDSPYKIYQHGITHFDASEMDLNSISDFLLHRDNHHDSIPGYFYFSGGFQNRLVRKPERKVRNIVRFESGGDWQYATVVKRKPKKSLLAYYDGKHIRMEWKIHNDYESILYEFGNSNALVLRIQNQVARIERDDTHRWHGLTPFLAGSSLRSSEFISVFQLRSEDSEHKIDGYSPKMVEGILNLSNDLSFRELLDQVVEVRKHATPNDDFNGNDLGTPREGLSITRMAYAHGTLESALEFISSSRGTFVDSTYTHHGEETPLRRLVEQGVELTGYDTKFHEFVTPSLKNVEKGMTIMEELYETIMKKEYTSLRELQRDVAKIHWWGDHLTAYKRGSAGIMEGLTKYIFLRKGFLPSPWKNDVIPYSIAMTHSLSEYVELYPDMFQ